MKITKTSKASPGADWDIALYRLMLKIRLAEQKIIELYPTDKIQSPIHLSIGQEAVAVGVCRALKAQDHIYGTYRGHGVYIARGGDLGRMFAELYGKATGCTKGKGGSMHLVAPEVGLMGCSAIVGSTIPVAVGDALAAKMRGSNRVVVSMFGDGGVDEGIFFESVNFAVLKSLPVLFILENNGYAVHSPVRARHGQTELFRIAEGLGLPGKRCDGDDVHSVLKEVGRAAEAARKGRGPSLLEFTTYRWHEHVGPGMDFGEAYRRPGEKARAMAGDPLKKARAALVKRFKLERARFDDWENQARREIEDAVEFAEKSPFPGPESLLSDLYA